MLLKHKSSSLVFHAFPIHHSHRTMTMYSSIDMHNEPIIKNVHCFWIFWPGIQNTWYENDYKRDTWAGFSVCI